VIYVCAWNRCQDSRAHWCFKILHNDSNLLVFYSVVCDEKSGSQDRRQRFQGLAASCCNPGDDLLGDIRINNRFLSGFKQQGL
jgi:hypothetical protein